MKYETFVKNTASVIQDWGKVVDNDKNHFRHRPYNINNYLLTRPI